MAKELTATEIIEKARTGLVIDSRAVFWASILLKLRMEEDEQGMIVPTMATDGERIIFNSSFVKGLNLFKIIGTLVHETAHVVFLHPYRRGKRDPFIWNLACDFAINPMVLEAGFELPDGALVDPQFHDMEAEAIYDILEKRRPKQPQQGKGKGKGQEQGQQGQGQGQAQDPGGCGGVMDVPHATPQELEEKKQERKIDIDQAMNVAKRQGKLPGGLARKIEDVLQPVIDWREKLASFVDTYSRNDYTWTVPNRRYTGAGFYLPTLRSPELGEIVVMIDASGSVSNPELQALVTEAMAITEIYQGVTLQTIFFDSVADKPIEITIDTDVKALKVDKGGGTDYRPPFKMVDKAGLSPVCIVVLTDGCCSSFPKTSQAPVLWVLNAKSEYFKPPFGDTVVMEREG